MRIAWEKDEEIYTTLEPLLSDSRKLRRRTREGFELTYMDSFIDDLLNKPRISATTLPKLNPRTFLEDEDRLEPRESALGDELDELNELDNESEGPGNGHLESDGAERGDDSMD